MAEHANVYPLRRAPEREPQRKPQPEPRPQEPLWREVLGRRLRTFRQDRQETLAETAARAGLSPQYPSFYQIAVTVPNVPAGDAVALQIQMNGITTTDQLKIAIGTP